MAAFLAVVLLAGASAQSSESMNAIVRSYLEIHAQLASDKMDAIKAPAEVIAGRASELGQEGPAIAKAAKSVAAAQDLNSAREAFGPLSDAVIAALKAHGGKDQGDVKVAYCPMIRRSWLQKDAKIRNPYYGSAMLDCGEIKK
jgi:hypothetical protein